MDKEISGRIQVGGHLGKKDDRKLLPTESYSGKKKKKKRPKIQDGDPVGISSHPTLEPAEKKK